MIKNLRPVALEVDNLNQAIKFYEALGCVLQSRDIEEGEFISALTGVKRIILETCKLNLAGVVRIELIHQIRPRKMTLRKIQKSSRNIGHISLTVDNIENVMKLLIQEGASKHNQIVVSENSHSVHAVRAYHCYLYDPWGNIIHLAEDMN
jgi:catechol 2,3-dioxygenase-like lactoylglutathione lyase family enzyme